MSTDASQALPAIDLGRIRVLYFSHAGDDVYGLIRNAAGSRFELVFLEADDDDERCRKIAECEAVICAATPLRKRHIDAARRLRIVHHQGVGWQDTTDWHELKRRDLALALTPEGTTIGVAEHTVLLILAAAKRLPFADSELRAGKWHVNALRGVSREIFGSVVGYVGMGRIAQAVARRLKAFGCAGIYTDPHVRLEANVEQDLDLRSASLDDVLSHADILTLHVPLTDTTRHMIGAAELARMKPGGIVVNTARGGLIDETALVAALRSGQLLAAGLDVFDTEPIGKDDPVLSLPNVVVTPHISAGTQDAMRQKMTAVFRNLDRFFTSGDLANRVTFP